MWSQGKRIRLRLRKRKVATKNDIEILIKGEKPSSQFVEKHSEKKISFLLVWLEVKIHLGLRVPLKLPPSELNPKTFL